MAIVSLIIKMKITKEQAQEMIKKMGCVEITRDEFDKLNGVGESSIFYGNGYQSVHFKQKEVYPKVFEGTNFNFEVTENGYINQEDKCPSIWIFHRLEKEDINSFKEAVEESKRITEKKE